MRKQLVGHIVEIIPSQKYKLWINLGYDEEKKYYPRTSRIFYGTKREAEGYLRVWLYELENPEEIKATESVGDWLESWVDNDAKILLKWEQNTYDRAKRIISKNIKPHIGTISLGDLTPDNVMNLYNKLGSANSEQKKLSPRSLRYVHTILNQALNHAVKMQKIDINPAKGLTPAASKSKDKEKWVVMSKEQLSTFLKAIKSHQDYALIFLAAYTGARQSELL